jgi:hypothetical protein
MPAWSANDGLRYLEILALRAMIGAIKRNSASPGALAFVVKSWWAQTQGANPGQSAAD